MSRAAGSNGRLTHEDIDQMSSSDDEEPPPLVGSPESSEDEAPPPLVESPEQRVLATAIVVRQHRGLSVPKMLLIKEGITTFGWVPPSKLVVQLLANGNYFLVDGLHRLKAVLDLITDNSLPADYTVPCIVISADTPANVVKGYFISLNDPHPTPGSAVARVMNERQLSSRENGHNFFSLHTRISVYIICLYHIFYISRPAGSNFIYPKENEEPPPLVDHGTSLYPVFQPVGHTFEDLARWARGPLLAKSFLPVGHTHEIDSEFLLRVPNGLYLSSL